MSFGLKELRVDGPDARLMPGECAPEKVAQIDHLGERRKRQMDAMQEVAKNAKWWSDTFGYNPYGRGGYGDGVFRADRSKVRFEFIEIQYGVLRPFNVKPNSVQRSTFRNGGSMANKETFSVNKKTTNTFTYTFKESTGIKTTTKANIPLFGSGKVEVSLNFESTQAQTNSTEQSWVYATDINVAPRKRVVTSFVVNEEQYSVPFTAKVRARGHVYVEYPPRYRVTKNYWEGELDDMKDLYNAGREFWIFDILGTFDATYGVTYDVKVDEFEYVPTDMVAADTALTDASSGETVDSSTIDCGINQDNNIQSKFTEIAELSKNFNQS
jgi:hypothetical protein